MLSKGVVVPNQIIILFIGIGQAKLIGQESLIGACVRELQVGSEIIFTVDAITVNLFGMKREIIF